MYRAHKPYNFKGRSIYSKRYKRRSKPLVAAAVVVLAAVLVFLGWSIEPIVQNLVTGKYRPSSAASKPTHAASVPSSKPSSSKPSSSTQAASASVKGIFLPKSDLSDLSALDQAASAAKGAGLNMGVIELKGEDGVIAYNSKISEAQGDGMMASNAPDAAAAAAEIAKYGLTPAAKISCFKDPAAASAMHEAAVMYAPDHSMRWLDLNGNRWLNPYNTQAQQYIIDLAKEAVSLGFKQIYLDNVEFPTGDQKAWYGDNLPSREEALKSFVAAVKQQVEAAGGKMSVILPGDAVFGQADPATGQNQSIYGFSADYLSPNLCPSLLKAGISVGSSVIGKPDLAPGDTVTAEAAYLKTQAGAGLSRTVPLIQDFTNTAIGSGNYKTYTPADLSAEIAGLKGAGIANYIIYSPDGKYDLSSLGSK